MPEKPSTRAGYPLHVSEYSRSTCLYLATKLGDLSHQVVVVGGLVPGMIVRHDPQGHSQDREVHIGTMDVDLGLSLSLLADGSYLELRDRLLEAKLKPDTNPRGNPTPQRWVLEYHAAPGGGGNEPGRQRTTVDFLIAREGLLGDDTTASKFLAGTLAAQPAEGLQLAFRDTIPVQMQGLTPFGESASRTINVCGPAAFVVLKALAFRNRGMNKDAYDLHYVVRWFGAGPQDVADRLRPIMADPAAVQALEVLRSEFSGPQSTGPMRVAEFRGVTGEEADEVKADVVGDIQALLSRLE